MKQLHTSAGSRSKPGTGLFLPMNRADMEARGWKELDILLVSGDAYVDHPSFGVPLLGRWLEHHGFRVGIVAQPRWQDTEDVLVMGRPRLFAAVAAGAVDSLLAHYTAFRKKRHDDAYTPGGKAGARPNRAVSVYTGLLRRAFPGLPVVGGGIEASLRRVSHYDFWTDSLRKSILPDAKLDLLLYGMGESALLETAQRLDALSRDSAYVQLPAKEKKQVLRQTLAGIPGTAHMGGLAAVTALRESGVPLMELPSHTAMVNDKALLITATQLLERQVHQMQAVAVQEVDGRYVILEKPAPLLSTSALDSLYALPFTRQPHPSYSQPIPAASMMLSSLTCHRGCGGGCSFCSLALHQGRRIASRSRESLLDEARKVVAMPGFTGAISDVGGPSANMWRARCGFDPDKCTRPSCMVPRICPGFTVDQREHINLLREMGRVPGIRHVRVASGVRFDLALQQDEALEAYAGEFTGGQLKVAPEHCSADVLTLMRKPGMESFEVFLRAFERYSRQRGKEQYVIPYLLSAFPGCTDEHMKELARWLARRNWQPKQVQCFIPTPGTLATAMYYAEQDDQGRPLYVAKSDAARMRQHALLVKTWGTLHRGQDRPGKAPRSGRPTQSAAPAGRTKKSFPAPRNNRKTGK